MKYAIKLGSDMRVMYATFEQYKSGDMIIVDKLPDGNIYDYLYINKKFVYQPEKEEPEDKEKTPTEEKFENINTAITDIQLAMADTYETDESAITDIQMALAEIYEMLTPKEEEDNG